MTDPSNIVLVHSARADGLCWSDVIQSLNAPGKSEHFPYNCTTAAARQSDAAQFARHSGGRSGLAAASASRTPSLSRSAVYTSVLGC